MVVARVSKAAARPVTDALGPLHEALAMAPAAGKVTAMRAYNDSTERRQNQGSTQLNQLVSCMLLCGHCCCDISLSPKAQGRACQSGLDQHESEPENAHQSCFVMLVCRRCGSGRRRC